MGPGGHLESSPAAGAQLQPNEPSRCRVKYPKVTADVEVHDRGGPVPSPWCDVATVVEQRNVNYGDDGAARSVGLHSGILNLIGLSPPSREESPCFL